MGDRQTERTQYNIWHDALLAQQVHGVLLGRAVSEVIGKPCVPTLAFQPVGLGTLVVYDKNMGCWRVHCPAETGYEVREFSIQPKLLLIP